MSDNDKMLNDAIQKHRDLLEYYDAMGCKDDVLVQERYIGWLSELWEYKEKEKTIDAKPIIHAHWVEKTDWYHGIGRIHCTCSNCGYTVDYKPGSRGDGRGGKFCDDCGAKMDGDTTDET